MSRWMLLALLIAGGTALVVAQGERNSAKNVGALSGFWRNNLSSCMYLVHHYDGTLTGKYSSNVGNHGGVQLIHGKAGTGKPTTFGFAVSFKGGASTAAWSGLHQSCGGKDKLTTTWILTRMVGSCSDNWKAFHVGQDHFHRVTVPCMQI